jgi:cytochrome c oxidase subunit 1
MAGMLRRMADGGINYSAATNATAAGALSDAMIASNKTISMAAWCLGLSQIPFIINLIYSIWGGKKTNSDNPWHATTLEWQTPTPPPHGNFATVPVVYRPPYEYSVPNHPTDYAPQNEPLRPVGKKG